MNKKHSKSDLIEIGEKLFRERGYYNVGTEEILEEGQYPRSSFYHHFSNKEGFAREALKGYGQKICAMLRAVLNDEKVKSPIQRLKNYYQMIASFTEESNYGSSCLVQRFAMDLYMDHESINEELREQYASWVNEAASCVEKGQEAGEIREDMSAIEVSNMLFSTVYGGYTLGRISQNKKELGHRMNTIFKLIAA